MDSRYKLIKEYPGSPEKGTIVEILHTPIFMDNSQDIKNRFICREPGKNKFHFSNDEIRNSEFWEPESKWKI